MLRRDHLLELLVLGLRELLVLFLLVVRHGAKDGRAGGAELLVDNGGALGGAAAAVDPLADGALVVAFRLVLLLRDLGDGLGGSADAAEAGGQPGGV